VLSLRHNRLTGELPADWETPRLELLLLSDNQLTGGWGGGWPREGEGLIEREVMGWDRGQEGSQQWQVPRVLDAPTP
jgi:hypothetical protein